MKLDGATASLVRDLFGTTAGNLLAASVTVVIGFLIWGLSIGQLYQNLYARAWRIHVGHGRRPDPLHGLVLRLQRPPRAASVSAAELRAAGWLALLPAWIAGSMVFWLWTPRYPAPSPDLAPLAPARRGAGDDRRRRDGRHLAALDRADAQPEREGVRRVRRLHRALRVHPDRRHDLDGLCRVRSRVVRVATGRDRAHGLAAGRPRAPVATAGDRPCLHARPLDRPSQVESALKDLGERRRWLAPLIYAAGTIAVVFDGVLLLLRNWRLTLLQLVPAAWISVMTWNMKSHLVSKPSISTGVSIAAAVGVVLAAQLAYWCNATFAYTMLQDPPDTRAAFREARVHWRLDRRRWRCSRAACRRRSGC